MSFCGTLVSSDNALEEIQYTYRGSRDPKEEPEDEDVCGVFKLLFYIPSVQLIHWTERQNVRNWLPFLLEGWVPGSKATEVMLEVKRLCHYGYWLRWPSEGPSRAHGRRNVGESRSTRATASKRYAVKSISSEARICRRPELVCSIISSSSEDISRRSTGHALDTENAGADGGAYTVDPDGYALSVTIEGDGYAVKLVFDHLFCGKLEWLWDRQGCYGKSPKGMQTLGRFQPTKDAFPGSCTVPVAAFRLFLSSHL
ncbi:hypothetical protein DFP72DRAFT_840892 [Ephemerocybe angulata]|uniref:Uncharacterized protein n=1 Tax=Ephemerocybe angulata TaxID=980116 RepID=A0A8H6IH86_9AGAR|nr:hypothetical protein DFP72DRAFT_840892 [Tulosesus angulatus]